MLRGIIRLGHELGLKTVAEGVETPDQFARLQKMGCDYAQGFGIARPLALPDLVAFMTSYGSAPLGTVGVVGSGPPAGRDGGGATAAPARTQP